MSLEQRRRLGETDIELSPIGLGTVKFGRNEGVKYPGRFDLPDDRTIIELLALTRSVGINFIDTAPAYGSSEERLGELLTRRDEWIIATKVGETFENGRSHFDFSGPATRQSIERSLRRLNTDWLDIVFVHSDGNDEAIITESGTMEALARCRDEGKIRAIGVSTKTVAGGLMALERADCAMVAWNRDDTSQREVLDAAVEKERGIVVKKGLASGHDRSPADAIGFALGHPAVTSLVIGSIDPAHIRANVAAVAG